MIHAEMRGAWADVAEFAWLSAWRKAEILGLAWADLDLGPGGSGLIIKNTRRMHEALDATRAYVAARQAMADKTRTLLPRPGVSS